MQHHPAPSTQHPAPSTQHPAPSKHPAVAEGCRRLLMLHVSHSPYGSRPKILSKPEPEVSQPKTDATDGGGFPTPPK
ncbi:hypothetical protein VDGL01_00803 [Verticillium dahliae]